MIMSTSSGKYLRKVSPWKAFEYLVIKASNILDPPKIVNIKFDSKLKKDYDKKQS